MEITWLGRNCFRLKGREGTVLTDPPPPDSGYVIGKQQANIVTLSNHTDPGYSYTDPIEGARTLDAPGEYEVAGILVSGIPVIRGDGSRNMIFRIEIDGIRIVHLGLPDTPPGPETVGQMDDVDVLLMPVGGGNSLAPDRVTDAMETIDPHLAIPMNYKTEVERADLEFIDRFLKETGAIVEPLPKLQVTRSSIPNELTVQVLQPAKK